MNRVDFIPISDIQEGERRRADYGDLQALVESIKTHGVIQPITVAGEKPPYLLYAGGRRYRAARLAGLTELPAHIFNNPPTDLQLREIELEENLIRKDLTWQEEVILTREIHQLKLELYGPKISRTPDAPGHTMRDTAQLLKCAPSRVSADLQLAKALDDFPDAGWGKCTSRNDAHKLLGGMVKTLEHNVGAAKFRAELAGEPEGAPTLALTSATAKLLANSYQLQDCFEALEKTGDGVFHLAEVDPPYAIDLTKSKRDADKFGHLNDYNEVPITDYKEFLERLSSALYRVIAPGGYVIFWFSMEPWFEVAYQSLAKAGFRLSRNCGIWVKQHGATNSPSTLLGSQYDTFFYARKGDGKLTRAGRTNVFQHNAVPTHLKYHPTQRPEALLTDILTTFAAPGSRVLVPFAGSGVTLKAAVKANMTPIGYDLSQGYQNAFLSSLDNK